MSFGESVFSAGFIQKTVKEDLFVKGNYGIPPCNQRGKTLEDSRRRITEAGHMSLKCGATWPNPEATKPLWVPPISLIIMSVLHRLKDCIFAVL